MEFIQVEHIPSTGNAFLDSAHRHVARSVNRLYRRWQEDDGRDAVLAGFEDLLGDVENHFVLEGVVTRGAGYEDWREHRSDHRVLLDRLGEVVDRVRNTHAPVAVEVFLALEDLLFDHEVEADQDYWAVFRDAMAGPAPGEALVEWKPEFALGIETVDREHRDLVHLLNALHATIRRDGTPEEVSADIEALRTQAEEHFLNEEAMMRTRGYSGLDEHMDAHRALLAEINRLGEACREGRYRRVQEVMEVSFGFWFVGHILAMDVDL